MFMVLVDFYTRITIPNPVNVLTFLIPTIILYNFTTNGTLDDKKNGATIVVLVHITIS